MQKLAVLALLFLFSSITNANDVSYGVGFGGPYAGLIGFQVATTSDDNQHKYYAAIGLPGVSVGTQSVLENKHYSWGINAGVLDAIFGGHTKFIGPTFNYHANGFNQDGWQLGAGLYILRKTNHRRLFSSTVEEDDNHVGLGIQFGYHF